MDAEAREGEEPRAQTFGHTDLEWSQQDAQVQLHVTAADVEGPAVAAASPSLNAAAIEEDLELPPGLELDTLLLMADVAGLHGTVSHAVLDDSATVDQLNIHPQQQQRHHHHDRHPQQEQRPEFQALHAAVAAGRGQEDASDDSDIPDMDAVESDAGVAQLPELTSPEQQPATAAAIPAAGDGAPQPVVRIMEQEEEGQEQQQQRQQQQQEATTALQSGLQLDTGSSCTADRRATAQHAEGCFFKPQVQKADDALVATAAPQQLQHNSAIADAGPAADGQHNLEQQLWQQHELLPLLGAVMANDHGLQQDSTRSCEEEFADCRDVFASAHSQESAQPSWHTAVAGGSFFASAHMAADSSMFRSAVSTGACVLGTSSRHAATDADTQAATAPIPAAADACALDPAAETTGSISGGSMHEGSPGGSPSWTAHRSQDAAGSECSSDNQQMLDSAAADAGMSAAVSTALDSSMQVSTAHAGNSDSTCSIAGAQSMLQCAIHPEASTGEASLLLAAVQPVGGYSVLVGPARGTGNTAGSMSSAMQVQQQLMHEHLASAAPAASASRQLSAMVAARQMPGSLMLRDSELVDLSLSTSVHPLMPAGALPLQLPPLPSAAQRAVLRAANALDSDEALPPLPRGRRGPLAAANLQLHSQGAHGCEDDECSEEGVLVERTPDMPVSMEQQEAAVFAGLLFCDGRDSHGRPVVVINTDAIPNGVAAADAALQYLTRRMWSLVQGPYVLVLVACSGSRRPWLLPAMWCVRAYRGLARPFRKNVRFVLVVQPSMLVRTAMAVVKPFVSKKAHAKLKQVHTLLDIDRETRGEVQVAHLGEAFLSALQAIQQERLRQEECEQRRPRQQGEQQHYEAPAVLQPLAHVLHWPKWRW